MSFLSNGNNFNNTCCNNKLARHICHFIGKPVTIFTTSGGISGSGFTGVVLSVNSCFVRLITDQGSPPSVSFADTAGGDLDGRGKYFGSEGPAFAGKRPDHCQKLGSVCDIPIENIAAFCHNAV